MVQARSAPARQTSLREHNLALVLAEVADSGPASRARLASRTGLTKATVSTLVDTLVADGLMVELGTVPHARTGRSPGVGRPGSLLALDPTGPVGIGLEINVDYLATCTVDLTGAVRQRQLVAEDFRGVETAVVLARAARVLAAALDGAAAARTPVAGVAVAVPGLVESHLELLRLAPNLGWRDVAVLDGLREALQRTSTHPEHASGLAMRLDNEANMAALGELWCADPRRDDGTPLDSFVHVSGEIGVGAGIVVGGALFRGLHGFSGEIGHMQVATGSGARCACGATGCLELLAGQEAILRAAGLHRAPGTANGHADGPVAELVDRARAGDARAVSAIEAAGDALGAGLAVIVNLVDVDAVVLGGLYAGLAEWILRPVRVQLDARVLSAPWSPVTLLVSTLGAEAAVRGAATSVVRDVIADPAGHAAARPSRATPVSTP